jgi:CheY-like chemotaxis protein
MTTDVLRQAGYVVNDAPNGKAGLALYHAGLHDLVISDIVMPEMEGLGLIDKLRHAVPRPRLIATSGGSRFSKSVYLPIARHLGAQRVLGKPIRPDVLLQAVAEVLAESAPLTLPYSQSGATTDPGAARGAREPPRGDPRPNS